MADKMTLSKIMQEFIEKLIGRLEEASRTMMPVIPTEEAINIVNQLAEECGENINVPITDWVTDRVPTKEECMPYGREFQTTIPQHDGPKVVAMRYVYRFVRGQEVGEWRWHDKKAPWEPIAWKPLSEPYQPKS